MIDRELKKMIELKNQIETPEEGSGGSDTPETPEIPEEGGETPEAPKEGETPAE